MKSGVFTCSHPQNVPCAKTFSLVHIFAENMNKTIPSTVAEYHISLYVSKEKFTN